PIRAAGLGEAGDLHARDADGAAGRGIDAGDQVQQRRLARTGGSHQRLERALGHVEVDPVEHRQLLPIAPVHLAQVADLDDGSGELRGGNGFGHHCFSLIRMPSFSCGGGERTTRVPGGGPSRRTTRFPSGAPVITGTLFTVPFCCTTNTALFSPRSTTTS